ncbi:MAG: DUF1848 domain-containing protein [Bacteroides sp.]|nr:DUF1848 domain-containing protein [Bacteroides sp.]MCM1413200.1 DUF1848 domain-containing protein [Bacteroides sp.]MCM1472058.1 DUF1848 domain-containing protein [Bacteroides sp.]
MLNESGERVKALAPVIISASCATDIPEFFAPWFFDRFDKGYCLWKNPSNGKNFMRWGLKQLLSRHLVGKGAWGLLLGDWDSSICGCCPTSLFSR